WRWSKFLTAGAENKFNNLPEVSKKKDKKIYVGIYADFSAKGSDKDGDKLKFTWDFGDGGSKSYKKETRHKFKKAGKYKVTLKVSDGSEDKIETFNVRVEKFPQSKVKIVSVSPNPTGKDSDVEYIVLQNKSKKKINLKDWSVATGSKNLYNHPISEDIVIKPGKTITLTRTFSKFSLNNKKARVELRYPDGKVASKLAYDKKKKSVAEDEIYSKESGQWAWVGPKAETKLALKTTPPETIIPATVEKEAPKDPEIILASGQNFSEDENLRKNAMENFARPQGVVLGARTYRSTIYQAETEDVFWKNIFVNINSLINHFLNLYFLDKNAN
ncbi:MAG: PKD domain-containing protein, partial [Patescibacteria group bacterium]